jgi:putative transposase
VNVYPFIEAKKSQQRNVKRACVFQRVSRSAFYADRTTAPSQRERDDAELTEAILAVHEESDAHLRRAPGARRAGRPGPPALA